MNPKKAGRLCGRDKMKMESVVCWQFFNMCEASISGSAPPELHFSLNTSPWPCPLIREWKVWRCKKLTDYDKIFLKDASLIKQKCCNLIAPPQTHAEFHIFSVKNRSEVMKRKKQKYRLTSLLLFLGKGIKLSSERFPSLANLWMERKQESLCW